MKAGGGHGLDESQRQFAYDRLLARTFAGPDSQRWVLKGAGALLARLPQARHSRDLDLAFLAIRDGRVDEDLDEAVGSLREAADRDLGDHFRFEVVRVSPLQEAAKGHRLHLVAYLAGAGEDGVDDAAGAEGLVAAGHRFVELPLMARAMPRSMRAMASRLGERAAQGHALRALITGLTSGDTKPTDNDHSGKDER